MCVVRDRARALLEPTRALVNEFLATHPELDCEPSRFGTTVFPRLKLGHAGAFVKMLREQFETSVVPGDFSNSRSTSESVLRNCRDDTQRTGGSERARCLPANARLMSIRYCWPVGSGSGKTTTGSQTIGSARFSPLCFTINRILSPAATCRLEIA
jgi:hypothetical protein